MKKQPLLNTYVNNLDMDETIQAVERLIALGNAGKRSYVVPVNVDVVMKIEQDAYLKELIDHADLVLVDGKSLVWISKWHRRPVRSKISGSDLVPLLCKRAAEKHYSIFILCRGYGGFSGRIYQPCSQMDE